MSTRAQRSTGRRTIEERREIDKLRQRRFRAKKKAMQMLLHLAIEEQIKESPQLILELLNPPVPEAETRQTGTNCSDELPPNDIESPECSTQLIQNLILNPSNAEVPNDSNDNSNRSINRVSRRSAEMNIEKIREQDRIRKRRQRERKRAAASNLSVVATDAETEAKNMEDRLLSILSRDIKEECKEEEDCHVETPEEAEEFNDPKKASRQRTVLSVEQRREIERNRKRVWRARRREEKLNAKSCSEPPEEEIDECKPCPAGLTPIPKWSMQLNQDRENRLLAHRIYNRRYRERIRARQNGGDPISEGGSGLLNDGADKRRGMSIEERREKDRIRKRLSRQRRKEAETGDNICSENMDEENFSSIPADIWKFILENIEQIGEQPASENGQLDG